jgi:TolB-like protein
MVYFIFIFVTSSCAYHWGRSNRVLPGGFKNVSLSVFQNKTQEPQIEVFFSNALLAEFERSKVANLVGRNYADGEVTGVIENVAILPGGRREGGDLPFGTILASEYRILITVTVNVIRTSDGKVIWTNSFNGERTYVAPQVTQSVINTVNPLYNQSARRLNIEVLSKQMMSEAFALMTESF